MRLRIGTRSMRATSQSASITASRTATAKDARIWRKAFSAAYAARKSARIIISLARIWHPMRPKWIGERTIAVCRMASSTARSSRRRSSIRFRASGRATGRKGPNQTAQNLQPSCAFASPVYPPPALTSGIEVFRTNDTYVPPKSAQSFWPCPAEKNWSTSKKTTC